MGSDITNGAPVRQPLADWLVAEPSVAPPAVTLLPDLPFEQLSWQNFERLCVALAQDLAAGADVGLYGEQGDDQEGIDFYVDDGDSVQVGQSRRVKKMGPAAIEQAVEDFLNGAWAKEASAFVLATTQSLRSRGRADAVRAAGIAVRKRGKALVVWDRERLSDLLRERRVLVRRFFGAAWEEQFCGQAARGQRPVLRILRPPRPAFIGRQTELDALRAALPSDQPGLVALHGLSGTGKTELAARYAADIAGGHPLAVWLEAGDRPALVAALAGLTLALDLPAAGDAEADAQTVRRHLAGRDDWLVVVDGLAEPDAALELLPPGGGRVILTSQHHGGWRMIGATPLAVGVLDEHDAVDLLLTLSGSSDRTAARVVCDRLGRLALAVAQAGAFADVTATALGDLADLLADGPQRVLSRGLPGDGRAVSKLWEVAFASVEAHPEAAGLMHAIAWCDDRSAPDDLLKAVLEHFGHEPGQLADARAQLLRFSLVSPGAGGASMHRLVAEALRERGGPTSLSALEAVLGALEQVLDAVGDEPQRAVAAPVEHGRAAAEHAIERDFAPQQAGRVLLVTGDVLLRAVRPHEAVSTLNRASAALEAAGADGEVRAHALNDLGVALRDSGELEASERALAAALERKRDLVGPDHRFEVSTLTNLAVTQRQRGRTAEALETIDHALRIVDGNPPADIRSVAELLSNRATVRLDRRERQSAAEDLERAGRLFAELGPAGSAGVVGTQANRANVELDRGNTGTAIALNREALEGKRALYPPRHPTIADTLGNLANALSRAGHFEEAEARLREAIELRSALASPDPVAIARDRSTLGTVLVQVDRYEEGLALQRGALAVVAAARDDDHPLMVTMRHNLEESERLAAPAGDGVPVRNVAPTDK